MNESPPLETPVLLSKPQLSGQELPVSPDQLTYDEERDRSHLELKIDKAFSKAESIFREAVAALKEIRDRRLYRNTQATFEEYCNIRFRFSRRRPYQLIDAAVVLENLQECAQPVHILPDKESQCREIARLKDPQDRREAWAEITSEGKIAPIKEIKSIVERIKEKSFTPYTKRSEYQVGDVVKVKARGSSTLRPYDGYWGIVDDITDYFYHICISVKNEVIGCKDSEMKRVDLDKECRDNIKSISDRILALAMRDDLETPALGIIDALSRKTVFTEGDLWFLAKAEEWHGISQ
ncbi:hypothetical protein [Chroococcidiopsis sp.]|uniref:hypothetical protein n=1 Tax=Chroococcidiopsis sp. TaxID=3088168 RepID=UPI003F32E6AB